MTLARRDDRGFTLIELMIVTAILGILAYVGVTQYGGLLEKTAEGATKGGLGSMRVAAALYHGDHEGRWPADLNATGRFEFSRYLDRMPIVQVTGRFDGNTYVKPRGRWVTSVPRAQVPQGQNIGWMYDSSTGNIYVNSTLMDSKNVPYSYYGFE